MYFTIYSAGQVLIVWTGWEALMGPNVLRSGFTLSKLWMGAPFPGCRWPQTPNLLTKSLILLHYSYPYMLTQTAGYEFDDFMWYRMHICTLLHFILYSSHSEFTCLVFIVNYFTGILSRWKPQSASKSISRSGNISRIIANHRYLIIIKTKTGFSFSSL